MDRIFSAVLQTGIYSLGIILIIVLLRIVFKERASKTALCALWIFAAIRLVIPFRIESAFAPIPEISPENIMERMFTNDGEPENTYSDITTQTNMNMPVSVSESQATISVNEFIQQENTVKNKGEKTTENIENDAIQAIADKEQTAAEHVQDTDKVSLIFSTFGYIWLTGTCIFLMLMARRYIKIRKKLKPATLLTPYDDVYLSETISSAFIFGILNPKIYVSASISSEQLDFVLAHERAHITRKDHITKLLAYLILSVYWFMPWVWAAYILFGRDVELACDEKVISGKNETYRADYAQVLLDSTKRYRHKEDGLVSFGEEKIKDRIESVVNYKKRALWISILIIVIAGIGLSIFLFSRNTEDTGQGDGDTGIQVKLLEHASPITSCIELYRFDGEKTIQRIVFDKEWEQKVIDEVNNLKLKSVGKDELLKWNEPCYGISINASGYGDIWLTYSDGLWLTNDSSLYRGEFDLEKCFDEAAGLEGTMENSFDSGILMPNAAILSKYDLKYCHKASNEVYSEKDGVSLRMVSLDGNEATLEYRNDSGIEFTYGEAFTLQKLYDEWYEIPTAINAFFNLPLYWVNPGDERQTKCNLFMYGELEDGHYRIVKDNLCAEFDIPFKEVDEKVISYRGIISGESYEKGSGCDIQIIKTEKAEWKMVFVHWNNGKTRQTLIRRLDFDIKPDSISTPVTKVGTHKGYCWDFIVDYGILGHARKGEYILWNPDTLRYELLEGYSELCNAVLDTRTGKIYDSYNEGTRNIRNQYIINGNKLEKVATMIAEDTDSGYPRYTELQKIDGEFVVVQDNVPESEVSFEGWTMFIS